MKKVSTIFLLLTFFAGVASASYISLNTTINSRVENNRLKVMVSVINKGDEPAYEVQAEIRVGDKKFLAEKKDELRVNQSYKVYASYDLDLKKPGEYPLLVVMHYADANLYPFSALTCQTFSYKTEEVPSEIFGRIKSATFWKQGKAKLTLKNVGESEIAASTYLAVPREITIDEGPQKIVLLPKSKKSVNFAIKNFSALSGSNYQVFAITEYEKEGIHQTDITPGMLKIVEEKKILGIDYKILISILAVLIFLFIIYQFGLPLFRK